MGKITLKWQDNNEGAINEDGHRIYRSIGEPLDFDNMPPHVGEVGSDVAEYVDEGDFQDKIVYYSVSAFRNVNGEEVERYSKEIAFDTSVPYFDLGIGPEELIGGDMETEGFFGEVEASELFSGDELASLIGLTAGTSQHSNDPWLKFVIDGEIIYVAKKPYRHTVSWDNINAVNAVYNDENAPIVEKNGYQFRVTLMTGASSDPYIGPTSGTDDPDYSQGSEWNRLMYRVHQDDPSGDPWVEYTDSDIIVGSGTGRYTWTQETSDTDSSRRVTRGGASLVRFFTTTSDDSASNRGWRPALRLVG